MFEKIVYLDHAATTPVDRRVVEAMSSYFSEEYGNPSSVHRLGQQAEAAVERSRSRIASILNCDPQEIVFTSCGSESDNLALRGAALAARQQRGADHLLVSPVEHDAVIETARDLAENFDFRLQFLPVDSNGMVDPDDVEAMLRPETALVSVMYANNEIGTINPIEQIAVICRQAEVPFHTDAVQAASQLPVDVEALGVDLLSLGAHKFYGPKGVGALYRRRHTPLHPIQTGGGQEYSIRAGTQNVPYIVGMAEALAFTDENRGEHNAAYHHLTKQIIEGVLTNIEGAQLTGHPEKRLPNHASFVFEAIDGNALLAALDLAGFACSSGSACKTGDPEPSGVLLAIGLEPELALGSLRVTVGRQTDQGQIDSLLATLPEVVARLRQQAEVAL